MIIQAPRSSSPPPPIRTSSLHKSSSTPALQTNSTKLAQDDNTSASIDFSAFDKESKNSNQHIVKDNGHFLPPPPPSQTLKRSNSQDKRKKGKERNMGR